MKNSFKLSTVIATLALTLSIGCAYGASDSSEPSTSPGTPSQEAPTQEPSSPPGNPGVECAAPAPQMPPVTTVTGPNPRTLDWSGYTWRVKGGPSLMGPGPNLWDNSADAVYVDALGRLNLTVRKTADGWKSSEVWLPQSLGYGTYTFVIDSDVLHIDPQLNASPFLYADDEHELDIEFSRWGKPDGHNTQFVVQPGRIAENRNQFLIGGRACALTSTIDWTPERINFRIEQGGLTLQKWSYTGANNFVPGKEKTELNHWMYKGLPPQDGKDSTFIVRSFSFVPHT